MNQNLSHGKLRKFLPFDINASMSSVKARGKMLTQRDLVHGNPYWLLREMWGVCYFNSSLLGCLISRYLVITHVWACKLRFNVISGDLDPVLLLPFPFCVFLLDNWVYVVKILECKNHFINKQNAINTMSRSFIAWNLKVHVRICYVLFCDFSV